MGIASVRHIEEERRPTTPRRPCVERLHRTDRYPPPLSKTSRNICTGLTSDRRFTLHRNNKPADAELSQPHIKTTTEVVRPRGAGDVAAHEIEDNSNHDVFCIGVSTLLGHT